MLTTVELARHLRPGMHAATFGGNPLAARAGLAAIEMIQREGLLANVSVMAAIFKSRLDELATRCPMVRDVRVIGMMIGIELAVDGAPGGAGLPRQGSSCQLHTTKYDSAAAGNEYFCRRSPRGVRYFIGSDYGSCLKRFLSSCLTPIHSTLCSHASYSCSRRPLASRHRCGVRGVARSENEIRKRNTRTPLARTRHGGCV